MASLPSERDERNQLPAESGTIRAENAPVAERGTPCGRGTTPADKSLAVTAATCGSEAENPRPAAAAPSATANSTDASTTIHRARVVTSFLLKHEVPSLSRSSRYVARMTRPTAA